MVVPLICFGDGCGRRVAVIYFEEGMEGTVDSLVE